LHSGKHTRVWRSINVEGKKYRVTWKPFKDPDAGLPGHDDVSMVEHEREFTDVDQSYDLYQDLQKVGLVPMTQRGST